jgi:hypothetical protein
MNTRNPSIRRAVPGMRLVRASRVVGLVLAASADTALAALTDL